MKKKLKVNLFGESYAVHMLALNSEQLSDFKETAKQLSEPLEEAIFNASFFMKLNNPKICSISDVNKKSFNGLVDNYKSQIEIKYGRKLIAKFPLHDLFEPTTLFPLFNTQIYKECHENLPRGLYMEEIEIGLVGTYEVEVGSFEIERLEFHLVKFKDYKLLHKISYKETFLPLIKSDTLIIRQIGFTIS